MCVGDPGSDARMPRLLCSALLRCGHQPVHAVGDAAADRPPRSAVLVSIHSSSPDVYELSTSFTVVIESLLLD